MELHGHTVFIPGATSGIGLALALRLHEAGSTVIIGGRRTDRLEQIVAEHPGLAAVTIDVADAAGIERAAAQVLTEHPELDVLVTMAGIMRAEDWRDPGAALATAEQIVTTNLLGTLRLIAAFLGHLRSRESATIMTVSSGLAFTPLRPTPGYNASKAAIHMLTESLRLQLEGSGVQLVELVPPAVRTPLMPGHEENAGAMDLDAFVEETLGLLAQEPTPAEIQVEAVKMLRHGEARGDYAQVVAMINATDPHATAV